MKTLTTEYWKRNDGHRIPPLGSGLLYTILLWMVVSFFLPYKAFAVKGHSFLLVPREYTNEIYRPALSASNPLLLARIYKKSSIFHQHDTGKASAPFLQPVQKFRRTLSAASAVILDTHTGQLLYAQNPDTRRQPASTIKVLTVLLALHSLQDTTLVPVSRHAARMPRSKVYLKAGKQYRTGELIDAILLRSANDASVAVAEKIAGTEGEFAKKMTALARSFGAKNTVCKTANGLTARGQYTTARDLSLIFMNAMKNDEFARRIGRKQSVVSFGPVLKNHNKALWQVAGARGGKTGYTRSARRTYVGSFTRNGATLIVAFMGSDHIWKDVKKLTEYGFARKAHLRQILSAQAQIPALPREAGKAKRTSQAPMQLLQAGRTKSLL